MSCLPTTEFQDVERTNEGSFVYYWLKKPYDLIGIKVTSYGRYESLYVYICDHRKKRLRFEILLDQVDTNGFIAFFNDYVERAKEMSRMNFLLMTDEKILTDYE